MEILPSLKCNKRTSGGDEVSPVVYVTTSSMIGRDLRFGPQDKEIVG